MLALMKVYFSLLYVEWRKWIPKNVFECWLKCKIVIESDLCGNVCFFSLMNVSSRCWLPFHTDECVFLVMNSKRCNWNIVPCGHISWTAHVNIIDWRSLECQICNSRLITLQFWLCEKWAELLSLMFETALIVMNLLPLIRRQAWSNTQWLPEYGGAPVFPWLLKYGGFHEQVIT